MKLKQGHTIVGAVILAFAVAIAWAQSTSTPATTNAALGTWELVSHDYEGQQAPPNQRKVKILAPGHFIWVTYDKDKMKTVGAGTGTWTLAGDAYSEHIDFIDVGESQSLNGTDLKFTVKVSGDTLTQTGKIGGTNMKEVWRRLP